MLETCQPNREEAGLVADDLTMLYTMNAFQHFTGRLGQFGI